MKKINTKELVFLALLIALKVVMSCFLGFDLGGIVRINFSFVVIAIMAIYFGPATTAVGCGIADFIGAILFPRGAYFFGFTLSAMIIGWIYGVFLYKKHFSWWRIILIQVLVLFFITAGLNSIWLTMITGKAYTVLLIPRITEGLLMFPIEVVLLGMVQKYLIPQLQRYIKA